MPLNKNDLDFIEKKLDRSINSIEEELFANLWSEHCAYRSSKRDLSELPNEADQVVIGPGDDAGIIKLPNGEKIALGIESHNHPSYVDPYNGASTGVGGIIRDILSMGARPMALLDPLRFGKIGDSKNRYLFEGVVSGISDYGNSVGVPTVGGDIEFNDCYTGNPLVNVFCIGKVENLLTAKSKEPGNKLIILGSATGRDGLGGASFASSELEEEAEEEERHSVQIGDPFTEKLLIESVLELANKELIESCRDLGAAGLGGASSELCSLGNNGTRLFLDNLRTRKEDMNALELLLAESQERMLLEVKEKNIGDFEEIANKYDLDYSVLGELTEEKDYKIYFEGEKIVDLPVDFLTDGAPLFDRELENPERERKEINYHPPSVKDSLKKLLNDPNIGSKKWIYRQYDHEVQINTVIRPGKGDAALLRLKKEAALAASVGSNNFYGYLDPYRSGEISIASNAMDIATLGAEPLAAVDCLNFASPENKEVYWEFKNTVKGMKNIANKLEIPIVGGNVSFYNESEEKNTSINPTPNVGIVGYLPKINKVPTLDFEVGTKIYLIGETRKQLGGSQYFEKIINKRGGKTPKYRTRDLKNIELTKKLVRENETVFCKNIKKGGIATSLAKSAILADKGVETKLDKSPIIGELAIDELLFSESPGRSLLFTKNELDQGEEVNKIGKIIDKKEIRIGYEGKQINWNLRELKKENQIIKNKMWD